MRHSIQLEILVLIFGIIGAIFNIQKSAVGYMIWLPSNLIMIYVSRKRYAIAALFIIYTLTSIWGIIEWLK
jgi:nicotinamide riboside transporter PnuC